MDIKSTLVAVSYSTSHLAAATQAGHNVTSTHADVMLAINELTISLKRLVATMQTGDSNIATLNAQITALS
jgi:hypothetical protein